MEKFEPKKESTKKAVMLGFEAGLKLSIGKISIEGKEHFKEIPRDRKVIVVSTHITDMDIPLAAVAVGNDLDLAVTNMSTHHSLKTGAPLYLSMLLVGKDNFLPIDFDDKKMVEKDTGLSVQKPGSFNPDNFTPMNEAMSKGKRILMAGHNPSHNGKLGDPGYGAAYLSEIADAIILPVGVNIKAKDKDIALAGNNVKTFFNKPDADVKIGEPFELPKIEGIEDFSMLLKKRKELAEKGERLSDEEMERFSKLSSQLRERSEQILARLSVLVPEDKHKK
jgi:hypothetical protein